MAAAATLSTPYCMPCRTISTIIGNGHKRVAAMPTMGRYTAISAMMTVIATRRPLSVVDFTLKLRIYLVFLLQSNLIEID